MYVFGHSFPATSRYGAGVPPEQTILVLILRTFIPVPLAAATLRNAHLVWSRGEVVEWTYSAMTVKLFFTPQYCIYQFQTKLFSIFRGIFIYHGKIFSFNNFLTVTFINCCTGKCKLKTNNIVYY